MENNYIKVDHIFLKKLYDLIKNKFEELQASFPKKQEEFYNECLKIFNEEYIKHKSFGVFKRNPLTLNKFKQKIITKNWGLHYNTRTKNNDVDRIILNKISQIESIEYFIYSRDVKSTLVNIENLIALSEVHYAAIKQEIPTILLSQNDLNILIKCCNMLEIKISFIFEIRSKNQQLILG